MNLCKNKCDKYFSKAIKVITSLSLVMLLLIIFFIFYKAYPFFKEVPLNEFIFSSTWNPTNGLYGILPFIIASILSTLVAIIIALPIGLFSAIFISQYLNIKYQTYFMSMIDILAAIPSVIYGFIALNLLVPIIQSSFNLSSGTTLLSASLVLSIMIIPTVITLSYQSLKQVNNSIKEASLALGATKLQTIFKAIIPSAKSGILTSFLLGLGRALGETMAVILVAGNAVSLNHVDSISSLFLSSIRTLTGNIVLELDYAYGLHQSALFATGVVLFVFVSILNLIILKIRKEA